MITLQLNSRNIAKIFFAVSLVLDTQPWTLTQTCVTPYLRGNEM